jgi:tripartite motif-containing protein 71
MNFHVRHYRYKERSRLLNKSRSFSAIGSVRDGSPDGSSDDEGRSQQSSNKTNTQLMRDNYMSNSPRGQYMQKQKLLFGFGSRGSGPGHFTWPRGVTVTPDNQYVVADSSNHRVQIFSDTGAFVKEFGSYGSGEGEFDCLAGIAVNRIGQFIIADRYHQKSHIDKFGSHNVSL